ncbi:MAG: hypothetical protein AAF609_12640 [Cyanobacteria bacterium P01_C01_bin.120]
MSSLNSAAVILGILVSGLSLLTGLAGAFAWHTAKTRKQYAAERDFQHLKRNYEALVLNTEQLWREMEEHNRNAARQLDRIEAKLSDD